MVSAGSSKIDGGTTHVISARDRETIRQIKEIVGNHSETDIYVTLKESHMDPNEAAQKLLNQDPFHEVRRRRDKKKENPQYKVSTASEPKRNLERKAEYVPNAVNPAMHSDRKVQRSGYSRNSSSGVSRQFRVVRDNRGNQNSNQDSKPVQSSSTNDLPVADGSVKSSTGTSVNQKPPFGRNSFQASSGRNNSQTRRFKDGNISVTVKKDFPDDRRATASSTAPQIEKSNDLQLPSTASSSNSVVGLYSSSSDPVHVPSPDSRPTAKIGAIKREVGVVGANRQNSDPSARLSSLQASSVSNLHSSREGPTPRSFSTVSKVDNSSSNLVPESVLPGVSVSRSFTNSHSRGHQLTGHQKAPQRNKEWKPKSSQKASTSAPGTIGSPTNAAAPQVDDSKDARREVAALEVKMSPENTSENQNVIIASHIRVSETDRFQLVFGSLGPDFETEKSGFHAVAVAEESSESSGRLPVSSATESSRNEPASSKPQDLVEDYSQSSETDSPASVSEHQQNEQKEASNPSNLDSYADMRLAQENNAAYVSQEPHQHQAESELPTFSGYDPQAGYDISYFGPAVDHVRGQGLPSPQEVLNTHGANNIPSSIAVVQQQQQQQQAVAQMYPQLHVSHFANMMPYRQFLSPVYVPPMAVPGYSSNAAYPHPSNGSSYLLMPGTSSHLTANGLKYGMQPFKPVQTSNPTGFGSFGSPTGYTLNAPGVVGNATGLEDSSRLKYKDGNFYVPNLPAETSEIWMNQRDMQSASYYNMPGQAPHAAAYMPSHSGHGSYNPAAAAVAHSSHMQFPGLYHPTAQPAAIANPHHLGAAMGGNVGVAAGATGAQVGAYQQPQLGHINWTGNF